MFKLKRISKRIKALSVSRSEIDPTGIDFILIFNGSKKAIGLSMPLDDAMDIAGELVELIEEIRNETIL